jgi:hypothetical protein
MKAQLCDARWSGNPEYGQLTLVAAFGPTMSLDLIEYISVAAVTAAFGSALTAAHFWREQVQTGRFEIKSQSAAALEPTGVGSGVLGKKCGRGGATIRLAPDCSGSVSNPSTDTPSSGASPLPHLDLHISARTRSAFALLLLLILGAPLTTLAERRLESVGNPAGRRVSRPGPGMAHDGGPRIQACVRAYRA